MSTKLIPLTMEERVAERADFVAILTHEDLTETGAGTAQTIPFNVVDKLTVECVKAVLDTPFEDSSSTANDTTLVKVGDGTDDDHFLASTELSANGSYVEIQAGTGVAKPYTADDTVDVVVTPKTGTALADIDVGQLRLFFRIADNRRPDTAP